MKIIEHQDNNKFPGKTISINSLFEVSEGTDEAVALENKLKEFSRDSYSVSVNDDGSMIYTINSQELKKVLFEVKGGALLPTFASGNIIFDKFVFTIRRQEVSNGDGSPKIFEINDKDEEKKIMENKGKEDERQQTSYYQERSQKSDSNGGIGVWDISAVCGTAALIGVGIYLVSKNKKDNSKKA